MQMNNLMNMMNNSVLETDLALLRRNAESIVRAIPAGTKLLPVLKCDAYGLGAAEIARVLEPLEAVAGFAVAHVSEGLALRNAGITKDILVMSSALPSAALRRGRGKFDIGVRPGGLRLGAASRRRGCGQTRRHPY